MTTVGKLTVMQAFLDGKKIQRKLSGDPDSEYVNLGEEPQWNWEAYSFRVRPEPMEIKVWVKEGSDPIQWLLINASSGLATPDDAMKLNGYTLKTFVEKV